MSDFTVRNVEEIEDLELPIEVGTQLRPLRLIKLEAEAEIEYDLEVASFEDLPTVVGIPTLIEIDMSPDTREAPLPAIVGEILYPE